MTGELDCDQVVELVTDYLERRLDTADAAALEAHLARCEGCEHYLAQMELLVRLGAEQRTAEVRRLAERLLPAFRTYRRGLA